MLFMNDDSEHKVDDWINWRGGEWNCIRQYWQYCDVNCWNWAFLSVSPAPWNNFAPRSPNITWARGSDSLRITWYENGQETDFTGIHWNATRWESCAKTCESGFPSRNDGCAYQSYTLYRNNHKTETAVTHSTKNPCFHVHVYLILHETCSLLTFMEKKNS